MVKNVRIKKIIKLKQKCIELEKYCFRYEKN